MTRKTERVFKAVSSKREPSDKQVFKRKAKNFVEGLARSVFQSNFKSVQMKSRERRAEITFKLLVLGYGAIDKISLLNSEVLKSIGSKYTLDFTGKINARNGKEEIYVNVTVFDNEFKKFLLDDCFSPEKVHHEQRAKSRNAQSYPELCEQ